jgi:hypothetical protein
VQNGKPLGDTVVIANPVGATSSNFFVVTGPDGTFALDTLAPGAYVIYPMLGGGGGRPKDMYTRKVEVTAVARMKVEIDATPGPIAPRSGQDRHGALVRTPGGRDPGLDQPADARRASEMVHDILRRYDRPIHWRKDGATAIEGIARGNTRSGDAASRWATAR